MLRLLPVRAPIFLAILTVCCLGWASAADARGDDPPPAEEDVCDGLHGAAFGLCVAFCEAQDCDEHPRPSCEVLRQAFFRHTGSSIFPCEEKRTPTSTPTFTPLLSTPTHTPTRTSEAATFTPTETHTLAVPTGTATATSTATPPEAATATATATLAVPTGTATATVTPPDDTATPTATETLAVPTGTATATLTPPDDTATPTATETLAVPTGTATATLTPPADTATPTATETLAVPTGTATVTMTPPADTATPTATETLAVPTGTATATLVPETPTPTLGVPTGTATATATPTQPAEPGLGPCAGLTGGAFGLCRAFCALNCDDDPRFPCRIIRLLFRSVAGDTPLSCEVAPALSEDPCAEFSGREARLCQVFCEKCQTSKFKSSCARLQRRFERLTGGAALPCPGTS